MPFKHAAHGSRAVGEEKMVARANDGIDTLKPRTFHATTRCQPRWCSFSVAVLTERTTRVGRARKTPSFRPFFRSSELVDALVFESELASRRK